MMTPVQPSACRKGTRAPQVSYGCYRIGSSVPSDRSAVVEGSATVQKVNLSEKLARFQDLRSPKGVGAVNDFHVKLVKLKGEFVWHSHDVEDELFLVLQGTLRMQFRDREIRGRAGGVHHRPARHGSIARLPTTRYMCCCSSRARRETPALLRASAHARSSGSDRWRQADRSTGNIPGRSLKERN